MRYISLNGVFFFFAIDLFCENIHSGKNQTVSHTEKPSF